MSEYTDIKNNTYKIEQNCLLNDEEKIKLEDEIVEELYNIFTKK